MNVCHIQIVGATILWIIAISPDALAGPPWDCTNNGTCVNNTDNTSATIGVYSQESGSGITGGVYGGVTSTSGVGVTGVCTTGITGCPTTGIGVCGFADPGYYAGYFSTASTGSVPTLYSKNTSTALGTAIVGSAAGTGYGVEGENTGSSCAGSECSGVYGTSTNAYGVYGSVDNGTGAVAGVNTSTGTCTLPSCEGVYASGANGPGLYAISTSSYGVYGTTTTGSPASGYGVSGVYGYSSSDSDNGVLGVGGTGVSGIGQTNGIYGDCTGTGCFAGYFVKDVYINGTTYPPSDRRLKKNIVPLSGAIDQLLSLHGVNFEWKEPEKHNDAAGKQIGFIAQDVEQVFPNWVKTSEDGFKALSVAQIEGLEVESIRTLKMENDSLKDRLSALESGRRPMVSGFDLNGIGFGVGGLAIAGAILVTQRRKRVEAKAL